MHVILLTLQQVGTAVGVVGVDEGRAVDARKAATTASIAWVGQSEAGHVDIAL